MTLPELLCTLQKREVRIEVRGGRVWVAAPLGAVSGETRAAIERYRETLVALQVSWRDVLSTWPPEDRAVWEERAAIMEYDGGLPRREAERLAFEDVARTLEYAAGEAPEGSR